MQMLSRHSGNARLQVWSSATDLAGAFSELGKGRCPRDALDPVHIGQSFPSERFTTFIIKRKEA